MIKNLFGDKGNNYLFAVVIWIIFYFIMLAVFRLGFEWQGGFWKLASFMISAIIAFGSNSSIPIMTKEKLVLIGEEVSENGDPVWLGPGFYFTFWVFSFAKGEIQKIERQDVIVQAFQCQDRSGKSITVEANGDWIINDSEKFKMQDAKTMPSNLTSLIKRTLMRVCGTLLYEDNIKGQDLGEIILGNNSKDLDQGDKVFKRECQKYGIIFNNLIADGVASDLKQENLNRYHNQLFEKEKNKYPPGYRFTHQELEEIEARIQVRLGQAKRIITNSALLGRYDV